MLAAQYESWTLPGAVMTAVPFGILGALLTNWLRGLENDVYFQIGLLVLIGLGAKNAVLRVSVAVEFRQQGKSIMEATVLAGEQRLRPIIMTSLAFAIGCLPLAIALGAGANARHSIGTGIIGGMLGETTLAMLYVPLFFYIFDRLGERKAEKKAASAARAAAGNAPAAADDSARDARARGRLTCAAFSSLPLPRWRCRGCMVGPDYQRPADRRAGRVPATRHGTATDTCRHAVVEAVRRPGARRADRRGARQQPERQDRRRQRRAGRGGVHAVALAAVSAGRLRRGTASGARSTECGAVRLPTELIPNPQTAYTAALSASWEIDLWGRIRRLSEAARANVLATDEARRGVILSLVASVATNYIQLRGLDDQLVIAKRTLAAYAESVRLFELQFKYGQVSQMTVEQAQSQYETAAAQIPQIESQIAQTAERAVHPARPQSGADPARQADRGAGAAERAGGRAVGTARAPARPHAGRADADRRQRPDRRRQGAVLSRHLAHRRVRWRQRRSVEIVHRPCAHLELRRSAHGTDLHLRRGQRPGRAGRSRRAAALLNYRLSIQNAFGDVDNALVVNAKLQEQLAAQVRLVKALKEYVYLARLQYDGGYSPYSTVLQAEQALFPAELTLASVRGSVFASAANIYKAMGGGWVTSADALTTGDTVAPIERLQAPQPLF